MAGVEIYRRQGLVTEWFQTPWHEGMEPFVAFPAAEAAAIAEVEAKARRFRSSGTPESCHDLFAALDARAAASTPDEKAA